MIGVGIDSHTRRSYTRKNNGARGRNPRPTMFTVAQDTCLWSAGALFERGDVAWMLADESLEPAVILRDEELERWIVARTPYAQHPALLHLDGELATGRVLVADRIDWRIPDKGWRLEEIEVEA